MKQTADVSTGHSHTHDQDQSLDEIESMAAEAAGYWLYEAGNAADEHVSDARGRPGAVAGFMIAAGLIFQAERQIDAAARIADGLQAIAAALRDHLPHS